VKEIIVAYDKADDAKRREREEFHQNRREGRRERREDSRERGKDVKEEE